VKSICITGIGGYLGLATAFNLVEAGHHVVGIGSQAKRPEALPIEVEYSSVDIRDAAALAAFFALHSVDTVYHFAAIKYVGKCEADPEACFSINTNGTTAVLAAMAKAAVAHIIYASTYAVYDWSGEQLELNETSPTNPSTVYGRSKLQSELEIIAAAATGDITQYHILRYANIVGAIPKLLTHTPQSFLDKIVLAATTGDTIQLAGDDYKTADGSVARDFVDVRDVATVHELLLHTDDSAVYTISSGRATTLKSLIALAEAAAGKKISVQINPRNANEPASIMMSHGAVTAKLGWQPQYELMQTVALLHKKLLT